MGFTYCGSCWCICISLSKSHVVCGVSVSFVRNRRCSAHLTSRSRAWTLELANMGLAQANDYRKYLRTRLLLRHAFFGAVLAFVIVAAAASLSDELYTRKEVWITLAVLAWVAAVTTGLFLHNANCPRCSNRFTVHTSGVRYNSFTLTCLNCGLSRHDNGDASSNRTIERDARKSGARPSL